MYTNTHNLCAIAQLLAQSSRNTRSSPKEKHLYEWLWFIINSLDDPLNSSNGSRVAGRDKERKRKQMFRGLVGCPRLLESSHRWCDENTFPYHGANNHEYFALERKVTSGMRELAGRGEQGVQEAGDGDW
ncbi:hypothetical protein KXW10_004843 [Aspergillus fumigatus]|nr:hypothetical protein KXW10_004843 [Aspergillus fumigatus]